jgi:hypothetical protein
MKYLRQSLLHHDIRFLCRTDCSVFLQLGMNVLPVKNTSTSRNWSLSQEGSGILLNETYACLCLWCLTFTHSAERMRLCRFFFRSWCSPTRLQHHSSGDDSSYMTSGTKLKSSRRDLVCWASVRQTYERFIENDKLRKALEDIPLLQYT